MSGQPPAVATLWQRPDRPMCPMRPIPGRYGRSGRGRTHLHFSHEVEGLVGKFPRGGSSPLGRIRSDLPSGWSTRTADSTSRLRRNSRAIQTAGWQGHQEPSRGRYVPPQPPQDRTGLGPLAPADAHHCPSGGQAAHSFHTGLDDAPSPTVRLAVRLVDRSTSWSEPLELTRRGRNSGR